MRYLGFPIDQKRLLNKDWKQAEEKMEKKVGCWQGNLQSIGGRVTLINACLSSTPLYMLSFFRVPIGVREKMDFLRRRFLWQEDQGIRKYHLVNWNTICSPREIEGLGILDLEAMNIALLGKWIWNLETSDGMWQQLIRQKYLFKNILAATKLRPGASHFWQGIMDVKNSFFKFCTKKPGDGKNTLFWEDNWLGGKPLAEQFPFLYRITHKPHITLAKVKEIGWSEMTFRRNLVGDRLADWNRIKASCNQLTLNDKKDVVVWNLTKNGLFSVKSFYRALKLQETSSMTGVYIRKSGKSRFL